MAASIGVALVALTAMAYGNVARSGFVAWDDDLYVYANPVVTKGLTAEGIAWALTSPHGANWHPLTSLSHMIDCELFGLSAGMHHLVNLALHSANVLLVFFVLLGMTGAMGRSAFVAALFALHPLHVESVAWVSERKDVLSTLFWLGAIGAHVRHARRPGAVSYGATLALFAAGLLSKPMVVTLPLVLLLLDFWPLGRVDFTAGRRATLRAVGRVVAEKIPFFALSLASSIVTVRVQTASGAIAPSIDYPLDARVANALVSYVGYIGKTIWPFPMGIMVPFEIDRSLYWKAAASLLILAGLTAIAFRARRRAPYLLFGWLWYLGTLVPVIGVVQVGNQAMADRYTYIPLIGLFVAVSWGIADLSRGVAGRERVLAVSAAALVAAMTAGTRYQVSFWRDSEALLKQGLVVAPNFPGLHYHLGVFYDGEGRLAEARRELETAVRLAPTSAVAFNSLGVLLTRTGDLEGARACFTRALRLDPKLDVARRNLAEVLRPADAPGGPPAR